VTKGNVGVLKKLLKGFLILWAASTIIALIASLTGKPTTPVRPVSDSQSAGPNETSVAKAFSRHSPPDSFRGVRWGSTLPSNRRLQETVLKGCTAIVEKRNFTDSPPCSHMHIDTDDMDLFAQREKVPPLFDVSASEQVLEWSGRKFWAGEVFIFNYRESDLAKLRATLKNQYGEPTFNNEQLHLTKWSWPEKKLQIQLSFDPVPKRSLGSDKPPQTSISLSFGKTQ
jgi:hypothetical protein